MGTLAAVPAQVVFQILSPLAAAMAAAITSEAMAAAAAVERTG